MYGYDGYSQFNNLLVFLNRQALKLCLILKLMSNLSSVVICHFNWRVYFTAGKGKPVDPSDGRF